MPEQPQRKRDALEGLMNADEPKLPLEDRSERDREGEKRVAIQREQKADQHGGDALDDPAGSPLGGERLVDQLERRQGIHLDVVGSGETERLGLPLREWMTRAGERDQPVVEQLQHADVRCLNRQTLDVDHEMATAAPERFDILFAMRWHPAGMYTRRELGEALAERLNQNELAGFARGDREVARRKRRIERLAWPKQALHAGKDHMHGRRKLERLGRRHQLLPGPHKQLVGENLAELSERMADGRRASPEALGGARHARVDEQRVERDQEIGVDFL